MARTNTKTATAASVEEQFAGLPSWKKQVIALVGNAVTAGAVYYGGVSLTGMLVGAAVTFTSSAFIAFMIAFIGVFMSIIAALAAGFLVQNLILEGGFAKKVSDRVDGAVSGARSWFGSKFAGA